MKEFLIYRFEKLVCAVALYADGATALYTLGFVWTQFYFKAVSWATIRQIKRKIERRKEELREGISHDSDN